VYVCTLSRVGLVRTNPNKILIVHTFIAYRRLITFYSLTNPSIRTQENVLVYYKLTMEIIGAFFEVLKIFVLCLTLARLAEGDEGTWFLQGVYLKQRVRITICTYVFRVLLLWLQFSIISPVLMIPLLEFSFFVIFLQNHKIQPLIKNKMLICNRNFKKIVLQLKMFLLDAEIVF
jgi:hypothetical protein